MKAKLGASFALFVVITLLVWACVNTGSGSDFDEDGVSDKLEDVNGNFQLDPGESDFLTTDTDADGLCDGQPPDPLPTCTGCEDCNNNGKFEPCIGETDPLNDDTNLNGIPDAADPNPLGGLVINGTPLATLCANGNVPLPYGASLNGNPFPVRRTPTPTLAPFPTSTPVAPATPIPR
jgi:hypothetical protein